MNAFRETFSVGERYRTTWTAVRDTDGRVMGLHCEWDPSVPTLLTPLEREEYFQARELALAKLAAGIAQGAH